MFKNKGIVFKTFVFTSALIVFVVIISFSILYLVMPKYYFFVKTTTIEKNSTMLARFISETNDKEAIIKKIDDFSSKNNAEVISLDSDNNIVFEYSSRFMKLNIVEDSNTQLFETNEIKISIPYQDFTIPNAEINLIETRPEGESAINIIKEVQNTEFKIIQITSTLQSIGEANYVMFSLMPYLLIVDIIIAFVGAFFFSKQFTRPIIQLSKTAEAMQYLTPNIVSNIKTDDEFGTLSKNLDLLYFKLCSNIESLQSEIEKVSMLEKYKTDFMRSASHELKTPIAGLNGIVEGMIDGVGKFKDKDKYLIECKKLINKLTLLVSEILLSSKFETTENILQVEKVDILEVVNQTIKSYKILIEQKQLNVFLKGDNLTIETDKSSILNAISNIISNAITYTSDNSKINILIEENTLSIENECENIEESELQKLFEPFYTSNYSRNRQKSDTGTGLGLFIVKNSLDMINLNYSIENTQIGIKFNIYFEKTENWFGLFLSTYTLYGSYILTSHWKAMIAKRNTTFNLAFY